MREIFFKDWLVKLLVLLAAVFLWVYVTSGSIRVGTFPGKIPLEVKNISPGLVATLDEEEVSLKLSAEPTIWLKLTPDHFEVYLDLAGKTAGVQEAEVIAISKLSGVQILDKTPKTVLVRLEPLTQKEIPVVVKFEGKVGEGFIPGVPRPEVEKVIIQGAKSVLDKILEATALFPLDGEVRDVEKTITLVALDERNQNLKNVSFLPEKIAIRVPISRGANIKNLGVKVNFTGKVKEGFSISKVELSPEIVAATGTTEVLREINFLETKPLSLDSLDSPKTFSASLNIPSGVQIEGGKETIEVKITVEKISTPS